jgi:hypothetical protein
MAWKTVGDLVFLWWNTGLSPPIQRRKESDGSIDFVVAQIKQLRAEYDFAVLGLGEVNSEELDAIIEGVGDPALAKMDATDHTQRLKFDTAIVYDLTKLALATEATSWTENYAGRTLKLGIMTSFRVFYTDEAIQVVTSHWPSRWTVGELEARKGEYGTWLRSRCQSVQANAEGRYIVLMGDYNDDPFSPSLAEHLLATRDRELAKRNAGYFYNPFWRFLGESAPVGFPDTVGSVCGTHYHPRAEHTEWVTFDQIIFSSAFLYDGPLVLNETYTGIVSTAELTRALNARKNCDHYPVVSMVTLRTML